jgi:hypothetical protein
MERDFIIAEAIMSVVFGLAAGTGPLPLPPIATALFGRLSMGEGVVLLRLGAVICPRSPELRGVRGGWMLSLASDPSVCVAEEWCGLLLSISNMAKKQEDDKG